MKVTICHLETTLAHVIGAVLVISLIVVGSGVTSIYFKNAEYRRSIQREAIGSYLSEIRIKSPLEYTITETIEITTELERVKHGVRRRIPIDLAPSQNTPSITYQLTPRWLKNNGVEMPLPSVSRAETSTVIELGDKEVALTKGSQRFELQYEILITPAEESGTHQFFWKVNTPWPMLTRAAAASIRLSSEINPSLLSYQGIIENSLTKRSADGSTNVGTRIEQDPEELQRWVLKIWSKRELMPYEQLAIRLEWPK